MIYSEKEYKLLLEKVKKLEKENEMKNKENRLLKKQNREQKEMIHVLDLNDYKAKYNTTLSHYKALLKINKEQNIEINELKKKVEDLQRQLATQNVRTKRDSSNSSKPSSTNGFKKVIIRKVIDIEVKTKIKIYKYYPDSNGKYNIRKEHNSPIQYGSNIKAMAVDLMISANNSTDAVAEFFRSITNGVINRFFKSL